MMAFMMAFSTLSMSAQAADTMPDTFVEETLNDGCDDGCEGHEGHEDHEELEAQEEQGGSEEGAEAEQSGEQPDEESGNEEGDPETSEEAEEKEPLIIESKVRTAAPKRTLNTASVTESRVKLTTTFDGYTGSATYTAYNAQNAVLDSKTVTGTSTVSLYLPTNQPIRIVCELSGEGSEHAVQTIKSVSGTLNAANYSLYITITYKAPCTHTATRTDRVEPTYKTTGYKKVICDSCGKIISTEVLPKLSCPHSQTKELVIVPATDKVAGMKKIMCADCGAFIRNEEIPKTAHVHDYEEGTIPASCSEDGYTYKYCITCGESEAVETIPKLSHEWGEGKITVEATCETEGVKTFTCSKCGTVKTEPVASLGHDYTETELKEATCKEDGYRVVTCNNCGDTKRTVIPKTSVHDWSGKYTVTKEATCSEAGTKELRCKVCNKVLKELEISKLSHKYSWVTTKEATKDADGLKEEKCSLCGDVRNSEVIPKIKEECTHPFPRRKVQVTAPTCSQREVVNIYCNECGELISENIMLNFDPDNHTEFEEKITTPATYKADGVKTFTCKECGYKYTEAIPKLECTHPTTCIYGDPATGKTYSKCTICDELIEEIQTPTCNHIGYALKEVVVTPADSDTWGEYNYVCSNCGEVRETKRVHPYSAYTLTNQKGEEVTIYGWFDDDYAQQVIAMTNEYRKENGLNELVYNSQTQEASNIRALEACISFSHTRPNGEHWNTVTELWKYGGENLGSGQNSPEKIMTGWKNSEGHNKNLLYGKESGQTPFKGISVSCFHRFMFNSTYRPSIPSETYSWSQQFTFYEYK